jgi:glycosyltransferase involved in cell wall biosynthesis
LLGGEAFPDTPGGLNRYFDDLFRLLDEAGEQPRAVVVGPAAAPVPGTAVVERGALPSRLWRFSSQVRQMAAGAGVIDAHFALYAALPVLSNSLAGRPLVVHFHGPWAEESEAVGERSPARLLAKRRLESFVYRRARAVVVLSHAFKRLLVERYRISPWRVHVVAPAVDLERFQAGDPAAARSALGLPAAGFTALTVRRLVPRMGVDVALKAWSRLPEGLLVVAGEGPERPRLEDLARELGLAERVRFMGRVAEASLPDLYRAADVSLIPSRGLEGFGLVALEALACGTPVITSDAGGLPEAMAGLGPDLVVPSGDDQALESRLERARLDRSSLPSPEACRAHAEGFSRDRLATRHREIYAQARGPAGPPRKRVVFIDHCARLSGGELALARIIESLDVDAHVILGEDGPLVSQLQAAGVSVEVLPLSKAVVDLRKDKVSAGRVGFRGPLDAALYVPRLAARLRALRPGVVHTNTLKSGVYGGLAARLAGIPAVWHLHDRLSPDYLPIQAIQLVRAAIRLLPTVLVANSHASLATVGGAPRAGSRVLPNPVTLPEVPCPVSPTVNRVGIIGRLAPWKGQHVFLEAFAAAFSASEVSAAIVGAPLFGSDEDDYLAQLQRQACDLGIEDRVDFRGFRTDVHAELARLDVLVHASVVPEPFGQVILEGMAAGIPVIAAEGGGAGEIATDGVDALLHPPGNGPALAQALRRMAEDGDLRSRLAGAGRKRASEFSPGSVGGALAELYRRLPEPRRR